jgi:chloramphenicol O-acetyltransferase type B
VQTNRLFKRVAKLFGLFDRVSKNENGSVLYPNSYLDTKSEIGKYSILFRNSKLIESKVGNVSYIQEGSSLYRSEIGNFCSIGANVLIGYPDHPLNLVSTSPLFYDASSPLPISFNTINPVSLNDERTIIGSDVWIGSGSFIKAGLKIGTGSVIGAGSIVTKDITPYSINVGNPSRFVRNRFDEDLTANFLESKWWDIDLDILEELAKYFSEPELFLENLKNYE